MKIAQMLIITLLLVSCNNDDDYSVQPEPQPTLLKVIGRGTAIAQAKTITNPDDGAPVEAFCFLMDLIDADTGEIIGTLEDCDMGTTENSDGTLTSRIVTKFNFTGKGSMTSRGDVLQTLIDVNDTKFTTEFTPTENNIVEVTDDFEGLVGKTTLVGEVDLERFDQGIVSFNCNFTIELKKP